MDVAAAQREPVMVALILILGVEGDVGVAVGLIGLSIGIRIAPRMKAGGHAEGAELEPVPAPMRFDRRAPVGRYPVNRTRVGRAGAEPAQGVGIDRRDSRTVADRRDC